MPIVLAQTRVYKSIRVHHDLLKIFIRPDSIHIIVIQRQSEGPASVFNYQNRSVDWFVILLVCIECHSFPLYTRTASIEFAAGLASCIKISIQSSVANAEKSSVSV